MGQPLGMHTQSAIFLPVLLLVADAVLHRPQDFDADPVLGASRISFRLAQPSAILAVFLVVFHPPSWKLHAWLTDNFEMSC